MGWKDMVASSATSYASRPLPPTRLLRAPRYLLRASCALPGTDLACAVLPGVPGRGEAQGKQQRFDPARPHMRPRRYHLLPSSLHPEIKYTLHRTRNRIPLVVCTRHRISGTDTAYGASRPWYYWDVSGCV
eukprot:2183581-Rhodomonas_salina.1